MSDVIEIISTDTIVISGDTVTLVTEGMQGPTGIQGVPGVAGAPGGTAIQRPAQTNLSGHRVVLMNTSGKVDYASNDDLSHASRIVGLTTGAVVTDADATIHIYGELIEPSWNWNTALPVYLGTNGNLTQTPPISPDALFSVVVGFPISNTSLFVNIREPIIIN